MSDGSRAELWSPDQLPELTTWDEVVELDAYAKFKKGQDFISPPPSVVGTIRDGNYEEIAEFLNQGGANFFCTIDRIDLVPGKSVADIGVKYAPGDEFAARLPERLKSAIKGMFRQLVSIAVEDPMPPISSQPSSINKSHARFQENREGMRPGYGHIDGMLRHDNLFVQYGLSIGATTCFYSGITTLQRGKVNIEDMQLVQHQPGEVSRFYSTSAHESPDFSEPRFFMKIVLQYGMGLDIFRPPDFNSYPWYEHGAA